MPEPFLQALEKKYGTSSMPYIECAELGAMTEDWFLSKYLFNILLTILEKLQVLQHLEEDE